MGTGGNVAEGAEYSAFSEQAPLAELEKSTEQTLTREFITSTSLGEIGLESLHKIIPFKLEARLVSH